MFRSTSERLPANRARVRPQCIAPLLLLLLTACGGGDPEPAASAHAGAETTRRTALAVEPASPWLMQFDAGEYLVPAADGQSAVLQGGDLATDTVPSHPGALAVQYQGGNAEQRIAELVADPRDAANQVLQFRLREANVIDDTGHADRGRVQLNAYNLAPASARELRFSTRMFLASDIDLLRQMNATFDWLTVSEWWNNAGWTGQAFPFRVAVNIVKVSRRKGTPLNFRAAAQTLDPVTQNWSRIVWQVTNRTVQVPTGRWVTLEYAYLEGNASTGRFYMAMTPDGGQRTVLFDIRSWTHHPDDPAPDGLTHVNPLKLYTSATVIDHVRNAGGTLSVHWDDLTFRLCAERTPEATSPCAPASFGT
jgi:hypothetical protein